MNPELLSRIQDLIVDETGAVRAQVRPDARLLHDLGIFGDDAEFLLLRFAKEFNVDLALFSFRRFFYNEPHLFNIAPLWWGIIAHRKAPKEPLTVAHLVRCAEEGRWSESNAPAA